MKKLVIVFEGGKALDMSFFLLPSRAHARAPEVNANHWAARAIVNRWEMQQFC
jgi:hypothetical protein